ncbi:MAG: hypothetical protein K2J00_07755 [Bacteroidaceae bacterium]|nr:hypothetical protein [Bacteroidaceae bacterium]
MDATINDVEALKVFRNKMLDAVENLMQQLRRTDAAIENVACTWKDSQFETFRDNFNEDKEKIKPLSDDIEEFEDNVHYIERILREYLESINNI